MATSRKAAPKRAALPRDRSTTGDRVTVENVHVSGCTTHVDASMYAAMWCALLKVLPAKEQVLTQAELRMAGVPHLPQDLFPGGAKSGWRVKAVQLGIEAKRVLAREDSKPVSWHRTAGK